MTSKDADDKNCQLVKMKYIQAKDFMKHRSLRNNKGIVDVQFNWIFVMIAGFVIFLFIISIVLSQKKNSDEKLTISSLNQITTILKGKEQSPDIYSEITIPSTTLDFACDPDNSDTFSFKITDSSRSSLPLDIIFSKKELTGSKLQMWTQEFDTAFPVSVFSYITTNDNVLLIYTDPTNALYKNYAVQIYNDIPGNISRFIINNPAQIDDYKGYQKIRIICFENFGNSCASSSGIALHASSKIDYMEIIPDGSTNELYGYGEIRFGSYSTPASLNSQEVPYIGKASMFGAIFSEDVNYYTCQMKRASTQYQIRSRLVGERLKLIYNDLDSGFCKDTINAAIIIEIQPMTTANFIEAKNVSMIYSKSRDLEVRNTDLTLGSCPKIY